MCTDTAKYRYENGGLRVFTVTPADTGVYECRAEVTSQGVFKVRLISLDVLCKFTSATYKFICLCCAEL